MPKKSLVLVEIFFKLEGIPPPNLYNYDKKLFIAHAAKLCGYSKSHFMKLFKLTTGKSFAEYAIEYRVEVAAQMLKSTDKKILDIALDCGFDNPSYFARAVKKKYGLTPSELRATAEQ